MIGLQGIMACTRQHRSGPTEQVSHQKWTFHTGNAKSIPKDRFFFRLPRAVEAVGRRDEAELKPFSPSCLLQSSN